MTLEAGETSRICLRLFLAFFLFFLLVIKVVTVVMLLTWAQRQHKLLQTLKICTFHRSDSRCEHC